MLLDAFCRTTLVAACTTTAQEIVGLQAGGLFHLKYFCFEMKIFELDTHSRLDIEAVATA
jgi:hypothetical protein